MLVMHAIGGASRCTAAPYFLDDALYVVVDFFVPETNRAMQAEHNLLVFPLGVGDPLGRAERWLKSLPMRQFLGEAIKTPDSSGQHLFFARYRCLKQTPGDRS
jgi:hypothetical protein